MSTRCAVPQLVGLPLAIYLFLIQSLTHDPDDDELHTLEEPKETLLPLGNPGERSAPGFRGRVGGGWGRGTHAMVVTAIK